MNSGHPRNWASSKGPDVPVVVPVMDDAVWDQKVKPIIVEVSARCHAPFLSRAQVALKAAEINTRMNSGQMPPMGSSEKGLLNAEKKAILFDWIDKL